MYARKSNHSFLKVMSIVLALVLVAAASIGGTLAWLTSTPDSINSTFTSGSITITLTESKPQVTKLLPAKTYDKDPTVTVKKGSEKCFLFVKVENGIADIESGTTIAEQMKSKHWVCLADQIDATNNPGVLADNYKDIYIYAEDYAVASNGTVTGYKKAIDASSGDVSKTVFETFAISESATEQQINGTAIKVTAYAVQAEGLMDKFPWTIWNNTFGNT